MTSSRMDRVTNPQTLLKIIMGAMVLLFAATLLFVVLNADSGTAFFDDATPIVDTAEPRSPSPVP